MSVIDEAIAKALENAREQSIRVNVNEVLRDAYERMMSYGQNQFQKAVQDSMLSLKRPEGTLCG